MSGVLAAHPQTLCKSQSLTPRCSWTISYVPITPEMLLTQLRAINPPLTSPDRDGWTVSIRMLPQPCIGALAAILNKVEECGVWPSPLREGFITLVPKGEGIAPTNMRPISVVSVIYGAWASLRLQDVILWQEHWLHPLAFGFRR